MNPQNPSSHRYNPQQFMQQNEAYPNHFYQGAPPYTGDRYPSSSPPINEQQHNYHHNELHLGDSGSEQGEEEAIEEVNNDWRNFPQRNVIPYDHYSSSEFSGSARSSVSSRKANHKKHLVYEEGEEGEYYTSDDSPHGSHSPTPPGSPAPLARGSLTSPRSMATEQEASSSRPRRKGFRGLFSRFGL